MKPKPDTPEWSAYSAGMRAFHAGLKLEENPITSRNRTAAAPLASWWTTGWREAERQTREDQAGPWK